VNDEIRVELEIVAPYMDEGQHQHLRMALGTPEGKQRMKDARREIRNALQLVYDPCNSFIIEHDCFLYGKSLC
jgi:hypothetical protein